MVREIAEGVEDQENVIAVWRQICGIEGMASEQHDLLPRRRGVLGCGGFHGEGTYAELWELDAVAGGFSVCMFVE